jgi:NAD(P)-dependent dehydrogenase (short-subunit alcohol dehydrogenase family)
MNAANAYLENLFGLRGKVAVVTGAASGIGRGIAEGYARAGAQVALVDINAAQLEEAASQIRAEGHDAVSFVCDISNADAVRSTTAAVIERFGKIDILVNNAGIGMLAPAESMTDEQWMTVLNINLTGAFFLCREVGKYMIDQKIEGRIINMASITAVVGVETGNANYAATKGGIVAMSRSLALEWAKHSILVNAIAPSHTRTPLIESLMERQPETRRYFEGNIPLGRLGEVEDIVGAAIFLASKAANFITGHVLLVDGGHTAR